MPAGRLAGRKAPCRCHPWHPAGTIRYPEHWFIPTWAVHGHRRLILVIIFTLPAGHAVGELAEVQPAKPPAGRAAASAAGSGFPPRRPQPGCPGGHRRRAWRGRPVRHAGGETFTVATDLVKATISAQGGDLVGLNCSSTKPTETADKNFVLFDGQAPVSPRAAWSARACPTIGRLSALPPDPLKDGRRRRRTEGPPRRRRRPTAPRCQGLTFRRVPTSSMWPGKSPTAAANWPHAYFQLQRDGVPA